MSKELIPIETPNLPELFSPGGLNEIVAKIEKDARSLVPDMKTAKGRAAIKSTAAKVASSKVYLDGLGKDFVSGLKEQAKAVDEVRRNMRDRLDALKEEVRRPLTEWENAEKSRVENLQLRLINLRQIPGLAAEEQTSAGVSKWIDKLGEYAADDSWEEFQTEAGEAHDAVAFKLGELLRRITEQEEAAAKAEQERREREEKERKAREERIAREAAERAKRAAEEVARKAAEDARLKEERKRKEAEDEARRKIEDEKRKREEAEAAVKRAERERIEAERRQQEALENERMRIKEERLAKEREERARAEDREHRRRINGEIVAALMDTDGAGLAEQAAKNVVASIAKGEVPHIKITY